jgi:hypothetical protein
MSNLRDRRLLLAAFVVQLPIAAYAQAPEPMANFDGYYVGISAQVSKGRPDVRCHRERIPDPLSITNGVVRSSGSYRWAGRVTPQGGISINSRYHTPVHGRIDAQGTITGEYHGYECNTVYVWRKQVG